ncbi:MAG: DUF3293 domain-containing protein [Acidimicrobiales bacterium]
MTGTAPPTPWEVFAAASVRFAPPLGPNLELVPRPPGSRTGPFLGHRLGVATVHVVTAWNPMGQDRDGRANARAGRRLEDALDRRGLDWFPCVGLDLSRPHFELGCAVTGLDDNSARRLGADHDQLAVFGWTEDRWSILACGDHGDVHLGWKVTALLV